MKQEKYFAPVYGLGIKLAEPLNLAKEISFRPIDIVSKEYQVFEKHGFNADSHTGVLEINYSFDPEDPSEPIPGISLKILNRFEVALLIYGKGTVGIAGILPQSSSTIQPLILDTRKVSYEEEYQQTLDDAFVEFYQNFLKAYEKRPMAFDLYAKSRDRDRFANNDKVIDCCSMLEGIYVPPGERLKTPFILQGLNIIGFSKKDIQEIEDLIIYRNAIIHADEKKLTRLMVSKKYTHSWFENTFELVRKTLITYVNKPWN